MGANVQVMERKDERFTTIKNTLSCATVIRVRGGIKPLEFLVLDTFVSMWTESLKTTQVLQVCITASETKLHSVFL